MNGQGEALLRTRLRRLRLGLALLAALVIAFALSYLDQARVDLERQELERMQLHARILESQTGALLEAASLNLGQVAEVLREHGHLDLDDAGRILRDAIAGRAHMRSISLVDPGGRVLASSNSQNVGVVVDFARLGGLGERDRDRLGAAFSGRDLADLAAAPPGTRTHGIPMLRLTAPSGTPLVIVAVLSPDRFSTQFAVLLQEEADRTALLSYAGQVLAAGPQVPFAPGATPPGLAPFTRSLPQREQGASIGVGFDGQPAITAFRSLRNAPLVVITEEPYAVVDHGLVRARRTALAGGGLALGGLLLLWLGIERSTRVEVRTRGELMAAHAATVSAEERLQLALRGAELGVWDFDLVSGDATLSPRLLAMLGHGEDRRPWTVARYAALVHRDDWTAVRDRTVAHLKGRTPALSVEMRMRCADGTWRWMLVQGMVSHRQATGRALRIAGTQMDIHIRKTAESALRASQARQRAILHSALDAIVVTDGQGRVLDLNPAAEAMFGWTLAEARNQELSRMILPQGSRLTPGEGRLTELTVRRRDGSSLPVEVALVPVGIEEGTIFALTLRDLTQRRAAERSLRESERHFRATFEQAAVGMLEQAPDRTLVRVNDRFCEMLGYTQDELRVLPIRVLIHPDDVEEGLRGFRGIFSGELAIFRQEKRYLHKDGHWVWSLLTASAARDEDGHVRYMIGVVEDISHRKQVEQALAEARERELSIGHRIQQELLVDASPHPHPDVWLSAYNQPSRGIDGDLLEVLPMGEDAVDIVAADVMGKGVPAALLGAGTKLEISRVLNALLIERRPGSGIPEPHEVVAALNQRMTPHLEALEAFVTLVYLRIDLRRGTLSWVGCGHEESLVIASDGRQHRLSNQHPPMGLLRVLEPCQDTLPFHPGDMVFLCSDGASDAVGADGRRLGRDRVDAVVAARALRHRSPTVAVQAVRHDLFGPGVELTDDVTMVMVCRGAGRAARIELPAALDGITALRAFVERQLAPQGLPEARAGVFVAGVVEAFTNIVRHGRGLLPGAPVEVVCELQPAALVLELRYLGDAYAPPSDPPPSDFAAFPEGGFGLFIIKNAADRVEYLHHDGVNTVRLELDRPASLDIALDLPGVQGPAAWTH